MQERRELDGYKELDAHNPKHSTSRIMLTGEKPLGIFIRSILGLDTNAAQEAFSSFLSNGPLTSIQIEFINNLIQQFTQNGIIEPSMLFEQPFTKFYESGIGGVFPMNAEKIISIIEETNKRAIVG